MTTVTLAESCHVSATRDDTRQIQRSSPALTAAGMLVRRSCTLAALGIKKGATEESQREKSHCRVGHHDTVTLSVSLRITRGSFSGGAEGT